MKYINIIIISLYLSGCSFFETPSKVLAGCTQTADHLIAQSQKKIILTDELIIRRSELVKNCMLAKGFNTNDNFKSFTTKTRQKVYKELGIWNIPINSSKYTRLNPIAEQKKEALLAIEILKVTYWE